MSIVSQIKRCAHCGEVKSTEDFHKDKTRKDGLSVWCVICRSKKSAEYYRANKDALLEKGRVYDKTKNGKESRLGRKKRYEENHPEKYKAGRFIFYCTQVGAIPKIDTRECKYCDDQAQHYHHSKGYDPANWLDIEPVCQSCHKKIHRDLMILLT